MNMPTKNILFALALPALIIVQTTHSMELPSQNFSLRIRLKNLPTEIQTHILGYVLGHESENWCTIVKHTIPYNPAEIDKLIKNKQAAAPYCYDNPAQLSVLAYTDSNSYKAEIINTANKGISKDAIKNGFTPINTSQYHPALDLLAVSSKHVEALYIFKETNDQLLAILDSRGNRIAFHPIQPILASTNDRKIDILHIGKAIRDQDRFKFPDKAPACTIASVEMPNCKYHSANYIQSISFNETGNLLTVISGDDTIYTFTCYTNADCPNKILDQLPLEQATKVEPKAKKPKNEIISKIIVLEKIASEPAPSTTTEDNDVPEITENELALIMNGCTIL